MNKITYFIRFSFFLMFLVTFTTNVSLANSHTASWTIENGKVVFRVTNHGNTIYEQHFELTNLKCKNGKVTTINKGNAIVKEEQPTIHLPGSISFKNGKGFYRSSPSKNFEGCLELVFVATYKINVQGFKWEKEDAVLRVCCNTKGELEISKVEGYLPLKKCDELQFSPVGTDESSGSLQIENLMDGSCQSLLISQPTGNSLKSISLAPPYDSSNVQLSEAGAIINLAPLFGRGKTMNINFELNAPAEPNTVIAVTCPCPLDVKLSSFKATLEAAKEQVALTWEIIEGNNAYLNIWGAQLEANAFKNVTQFNTQPIPIDETAPFMNFSLNTSQLNPGATYFALESVSYEGECVTYCDDIDAVVLGPVEVDLESVKNLCKQEMKHQIAVFGNTGSCVK